MDASSTTSIEYVMRNSRSGVNEDLLLRSVGKSISITWTSFQVHTSSHGIPNIHRAKGPFKRSLWILSMLAALLGLCFNIYYLAESYFKYNVTIVMEVKHSKVIDFPAVTICNNNPIKNFYSAYILGEILDDYIKGMSIKNENSPHLPPPPPACPTATTSFYDNSSDESESTNDICRNYDNNNGDVDDVDDSSSSNKSEGIPSFHRSQLPLHYQNYLENIYKIDKRSDYLVRRLILEKLAQEDEWLLLHYGHHFDDMIYDCTYRGDSCKFEDFFNFINNFHGSCYTFNSNQGSEIKKSKQAGSTKGLSVVFNVDQASYIGELSQSAGLRVVIHDTHRMPYPEDEGILVSPGSLTYLGVTMKTSEKLGSPYGNCTQLSNRNPPTIFQKFHNVSYTQKDCIYTCLNEVMMERCLCTDIRFPYTSKMGQVPCCSKSNDSVTCMNSVWKDYKENNISCTSRCSVPCSEVIYSVQISSQTWPSSKYKELISKQKRFVLLNESLSADWKSFGQFVVYNQYLANEVIFEKPTYEIQMFISDIGGVLGLYMGFSLLTLVEFLELTLDVLNNILVEAFRFSRRKRVVDVEL